MNKQLCRFAIIRFSPFIETEEFANIGVLIATPKKLIFKLESKKYGRVTDFFDGLDKKVYLNSVSNLIHSLDHYSRLSEGENSSSIANIFEEITRPRETLLRFSDVKVGFYANPDESLNELFQYYIKRNFITKEYKEKAMETALRGFLRGAKLDKIFTRKVLGDGMYEAAFPFVSQNENITKVIKPLHLHQESSSAILDVGAKWMFKIKELRDRKLINKDILFTVDESPVNTSAKNAYSEVKRRFHKESIYLVPNGNKEDILMFAREGHKAFI